MGTFFIFFLIIEKSFTAIVTVFLDKNNITSMILLIWQHFCSFPCEISIDNDKCSEISSINSPFGNDCGVDDDMESFSDEIATDFRSRKMGYRELDYYMEKIVEIQEQMASWRESKSIGFPRRYFSSPITTTKLL